MPGLQAWDFFTENEEFDHSRDNNYEVTPTPSNTSWLQLTPEHSITSSSSEHSTELIIYEDADKPAELQPTSPQEDDDDIALDQPADDDQPEGVLEDNVGPKEKETEEDSKEKEGRA